MDAYVDIFLGIFELANEAILPKYKGTRLVFIYICACYEVKHLETFDRSLEREAEHSRKGRMYATQLDLESERVTVTWYFYVLNA